MRDGDDFYSWRTVNVDSWPNTTNKSDCPDGTDWLSFDANKNYKVAGWATVGSQAPGAPIWDVVAQYMQDQQQVDFKKLNTPKLLNVANNPGFN